MKQYQELLPAGQGTPSRTNQSGTGAHFNPEGGPLQASPSAGRGDPDTSATGDDCRQNHKRGGDFSGSSGTFHGADRRSIEDEGRAFGGLAKVCDKGKGLKNKTVGQTGECEEAGVMRVSHPNGTNMDSDGDNY